jgi:hypothetical protein
LTALRPPGEIVTINALRIGKSDKGDVLNKTVPLDRAAAAGGDLPDLVDAEELHGSTPNPLPKWRVGGVVAVTTPLTD